MCVLANLEYLSILFCAVFWATAPGYYYYYYYFETGIQFSGTKIMLCYVSVHGKKCIWFVDLVRWMQPNQLTYSLGVGGWERSGAGERRALLCIYTVSQKKTRHLTLAHNFTKY